MSGAPREQTGGPAREAFFAVLYGGGLARRHVGLRSRERPVPLPVLRAPPSGAPPGNA